MANPSEGLKEILKEEQGVQKLYALSAIYERKSTSEIRGALAQVVSTEALSSLPMISDSQSVSQALKIAKTDLDLEGHVKGLEYSSFVFLGACIALKYMSLKSKAAALVAVLLSATSCVYLTMGVYAECGALTSANNQCSDIMGFIQKQLGDGTPNRFGVASATFVVGVTFLGVLAERAVLAVWAVGHAKHSVIIRRVSK